MELEQLRIFICVAECGSFSEAARRMYISHSTTSRAVGALEAELEVRLLERENRVFGLTRAGAELEKRARTLLQMAEETKEAVRRAENTAETK